MRIFNKFQSGASAIFWGLLLILLPITSMPMVRDLFRINVVAMPSILALGILVLVWLIPYLFSGGGIPRSALPLFGFLLCALFSLLCAEFLNLPTFKYAGYVMPAVSAFITLLVGVGFFLVTYSRISNESDFKAALKWIYLGGVIMLCWSLMQSSAWFINGRYPSWMRDLQDIFSLGPLYRQRASGFALEPSWLAHMLNMLYLPMWLSAVISGYSVFPKKLYKKISVEVVLLGFGLLVLVLTLSRVGWITFFFMAAYLVVGWNIRFIRWIQGFFKIADNRRLFSTVVISVGLIFVYILLVVLTAYGMSKVDPRMSDLFTRQFWELNNMNRYANALQFGERVVYWQAGWEVFNRYPVFGVGLGNAGRWFDQTIPSYGLNLIEVRQLLYHSGELPNIKNLWIRILAETGITGFAFFSAWMFALARKGFPGRNSSISLQKMAAYWGIFIFIGIILEGFSIDSFAMPYFWISCGLVLAANQLKATTGCSANPEMED